MKRTKFSFNKCQAHNTNIISIFTLMNNDWKNRGKDPTYNAKLVHAKDAFAAGCWVYSMSTKKLYTPREFMDSNETVNIRRGKEDENQFKIVDPRPWLQKKINDCVLLGEEIKELNQRIINYYDVSPKPKHKK
jgi:hypothetical protein